MGIPRPELSDVGEGGREATAQTGRGAARMKMIRKRASFQALPVRGVAASAASMGPPALWPKRLNLVEQLPSSVISRLEPQDRFEMHLRFVVARGQAEQCRRQVKVRFPIVRL
jgi:hypothetical protein